MANTEHVEILKRGVEYWNNWRKENPDITPDLSWATLTGLKLDHINLHGTNLKLAFCRECSFRSADLKSANLYGTNFQNASMEGANLEDSILEGAHLVNTNLSGANLRGSNINLANLTGAILSDCDLLSVIKLSVDQLTTVKSLYMSKIDPSLSDKLEKDYPYLFDKALQL